MWLIFIFNLKFLVYIFQIIVSEAAIWKWNTIPVFSANAPVIKVFFSETWYWHPSHPTTTGTPQGKNLNKAVNSALNSWIPYGWVSKAAQCPGKKQLGTPWALDMYPILAMFPKDLLGPWFQTTFFIKCSVIEIVIIYYKWRDCWD